MAETKKEGKIDVRCEEEVQKEFNELYEIGDFVTKGEAMKAAVSALKLQLLKKDLPGRIDEIDAFNSSLESLKSFYKNSLELAVSAKKIATKNLEVELETKTRIISDQQQKVDELNLRIENLQNTVNDSNEEKLALQKELDRVNALIIDKDALIQSLKNSLAAVDAVEALKEAAGILKEKKKEKNV